MQREVTIRGNMIRLGQLLKLAGVSDDGAHAKELISSGQVSVNGEVEVRRGRQLAPDDRVSAAGEEMRVVTTVVQDGPTPPGAKSGPGDRVAPR